MKFLLLANFHRGFLCSLVFMMNFSEATSQVRSFFNFLPDVSGFEGQSQGLNIYADSQQVYLLGDLMDANTVSGDTVVRPFYARFNYKGHLLAKHTIYDSLAFGEFWMWGGTFPIYINNGNVNFYGTQMDAKGNFHACMIALDSISGDILRYTCFPHPPSIDSSHGAQNYNKDMEGNVVAYHYLYTEKGIALRIINPQFLLLNEILIDPHNRWNHPRYIEVESDTTFLLIGSSTAPPGGDYPEVKFFFMRVNKAGNILDFRLVPGISAKTVGFSDATSFTVLHSSSGNWIISGIISELINGSSGDRNETPISICVSPKFDSLLWITRFSDLPNAERKYYDLKASCFSTDSTGFVVTGYDLYRPTYSFLVKIDLNGDTLWTRHFMPLGWVEENLAWSIVTAVQPTPYNSYVMAGKIFDLDRFVRRAWILHVDSMGCLIPGCDQIVKTNDPPTEESKPFITYPNPTNNQLSILYRGDDPLPFTLSLYDLSGQKLKSTTLDAMSGFQYVLSLDQIPVGQYLLVFENVNTGYRQIEHIVKLE